MDSVVMPLAEPLQCVERQLLICVSDRCACQTGENHHISPVVQRCTVTIGYPETRPDLPSLHFSGGNCAAQADIALAIALAAFLQMAGSPAVPK